MNFTEYTDPPFRKTPQKAFRVVKRSKQPLVIDEATLDNLGTGASACVVWRGELFQE